MLVFLLSFWTTPTHPHPPTHIHRWCLTFSCCFLRVSLRKCGCSRSESLRNAALPDRWESCWGCCGWIGDPSCSQLQKRSKRRHRRRFYHQPGTRPRPASPGAGRGGRPASPAAGRKAALGSYTSCCTDAPCLCCCGNGGEEVGNPSRSISPTAGVVYTL